MYDISFAKKLDKDTSNVSVKGKVTYTLAPKHVISPKGAHSQYDFWSQFIVIEDSTGSMGINITFGHEEDKKKKDDIVEVKGEIHKYEAVNKKTGEKEEKIVLNKGKIILSPEEIAEKEAKKEQKQTENSENESKKDVEKPQVVNVNNDYKLSNEWEIRKEAVIIAFNYGLKENFSIHDTFDLAKTIGNYIKSGGVDIKEIIVNTKLAKKEKVDGTVESKIKEKPKEKSAKNTKDLEKLFHDGQEIGLSTWVELIGFAVKKEIFPVGTSVEDARVKLLENEKECYDSLVDFIDIKEDVNGLSSDEQPTDEIPF